MFYRIIQKGARKLTDDSAVCVVQFPARSVNPSAGAAGGAQRWLANANAREMATTCLKLAANKAEEELCLRMT